MEVQDRCRRGLASRCRQATDKVIQAARGDAGLVQVFTQFRASTPQLFAEVDRTKAKMLNVPFGKFSTPCRFISARLTSMNSTSSVAPTG